MCEATPSHPLEQAEEILRQRLRGRVRELRIVAQERGVTLQGQALDYHSKQLVQHIAMRELKLTVVANEIEVRPMSAEQE